MATNVALTIAGRSYRIACGEGEERRLQDLGYHVDQTLRRLRVEFGEIGDSRLVIMTAISVADELFEAKRKVAELEDQLAVQVANRSTADVAREVLVDEIADSLDGASQRVERIVRNLRDTGEAGRRMEI